MTLRRMRQEEAEEEVAHAEEAAHAHAVGGAPTAEKTRKADDTAGATKSSCVERLWDPSRVVCDCEYNFFPGENATAPANDG